MRSSGGRASALLLLVLLAATFTTGTATAQAPPVGATPCAQVLSERLTAGAPDPPGRRAGLDPSSLPGARRAPSGSLPATGASPLWLLLGGLALVVVGEAIIVATRHRGAAAALLIGLSVLAGAGLLGPSRPAVAQTSTNTDACGGDSLTSGSPTGAPPPVVPEVPVPVLLPLVGLAVSGGLVVTSRRRGRAP